MKLYGLTGGIASGKSEAAKRFAARGIPVIDADEIGHAVIGPGGAAERAVIESFGQEILRCGKIDRIRLGALVFGDDVSRQRLNALVHPAIFAEIMRQCAEFAGQGRDAVVIDAALWCENGVREPWLDGLVLILAPRVERRRRLIALRGMAEDEAERRLAAQTPPESKIPFADWVIENDGALDEFRARVEEVIEDIGRAVGRA